MNKYLRSLRYDFYNNLSILAHKLGLTTNIDCNNILIGGEDIFTCDEWAKKTNDYGRLSMLLKNSWYVDFLQKFSDAAAIDYEDIRDTNYYNNALQCIRITGHYFECKNDKDIITQAKKYLNLYHSIKSGNGIKRSQGLGHSKDGSPGVFKIYDSDLYEILDGHHRLAINYLLNKKTRCVVLGQKKTYLQNLILSVQQTKHRKELYQPFTSAEFNPPKWNIIRNCQDRFNMMQEFLSAKGLLNTQHDVLDLACSYGWFVNEFLKLGLNACGIDRDKKAIEVGWIVYGLTPTLTKPFIIEDFIDNSNRPYDIVLFLSILHHYAIGIQKLSEKEILKRVDKITKKVLFLDTGQFHEKWFAEKLTRWNDKFIAGLIKKNTSFKEVYILGKDGDNKGIYKDNYGRTLFACIK